MGWLREIYKKAWNIAEIDDIAIGDSPNDVSMLEQSGYALLIRSRHHPFPPVQRDKESTIYSERYGPEGWAEGVSLWLDRTHMETNTGSLDG